MKSPSEPDASPLWEKLIGLGESSHHKSYYPELQKRLDELERFKAFLDYSNDAIFLVEVPSGRIVDCNEAALRQSGYGPDQLPQLSIFEISELADDPDACRLLAASEPVAGRRALLETRLRRREGTLVAAEMTLARMCFQERDYVIVVARDISQRKQAEQALWESEKDRLQMQAQLEFASRVQAKLLPAELPRLPGFEIAARCLPAYQVGGDFYDWQRTGPDSFSLTLGDVMGKGLAAAMLMATVRASLRAVARACPPAEALQQAAAALRQDLDNSESFVTLFHARLELAERRLTYVDCGHGLVYMLRADGSVEELLPRGLPLGVSSQEPFREGVMHFTPGDALVLFSDGLIDVMHGRELDDGSLGRQLWAGHARTMVEQLVPATPQADAEDDMTLVVVKCTGEK